MSKETGSKFGKGFIYCLILFSSHFNNDMARHIYHKKFVIDMPEEQRKLVLVDNPDDSHNYGWNKDIKWWYDKIVPIYGSPTQALNSYITTWANGATDHLYELEIPKKWEGTEIGSKALWIKDFGLDMGHGSGLMEKCFSFEDFINLHKAVSELAMLIDKELGVEPIEAQWE